MPYLQKAPKSPTLSATYFPSVKSGPAVVSRSRYSAILAHAGYPDTNPHGITRYWPADHTVALSGRSIWIIPLCIGRLYLLVSLPWLRSLARMVRGGFCDVSSVAGFNLEGRLQLVRRVGNNSLPFFKQVKVVRSLLNRSFQKITTVMKDQPASDVRQFDPSGTQELSET